MEVKKKRVEMEKNETGVVLGLEERPRSSPPPPPHSQRPCRTQVLGREARKSLRNWTKQVGNRSEDGTGTQFTEEGNSVSPSQMTLEH